MVRTYMEMKREKHFQEWMKKDLTFVSLVCAATTILFSLSLYLLLSL